MEAYVQSVPTSVKPKASEYETIYILRPNVDGAESEKVFERVKEVLNKVNGKLLLVENWGRRKLAYLIKNHSRGTFVYVKFVGFDGAVAELERNLRLLEPVMRYQTVLLKPGVAPEAYEVTDEDVTFAAVEDSGEEEEEESLEARLGLVSPDRGRYARAEENAEAEQESASTEGTDGAAGADSAGADSAGADSAGADSAGADSAPTEAAADAAQTAAAEAGSAATAGADGGTGASGEPAADDAQEKGEPS